MSGFFAIIRQTVALSYRVGGGALVGVLFFLSVLVVIHFAVGPDLSQLARIGPAILWIAALLATLLGLDRMFQDDRDDGSLDQLVLSGMPLEAVVLAKAVGHWVATGLPLVVATPVLGLMLNLEPAVLWTATLTLAVGTPALTLIGTIGAALMVALRRGGMMIAVLILPFTVPVLIFGVAAANAVVGDGDGFGQPFLFLCAFTLFSLVISPFAGAAAIKAAEE
ncbi:MAG: heme exporter protein CcmB [Alphaproteobacteria bacterium]